MKRHDREGVYTIPIWIGLLLSGIYVLFSPQVDPLISAQLENELAVAMIVGAGLCLVGASIPDRITAYKLEIPGLIITFLVLGYLAVHVDLSLIQQLTLYGGLGGLVQVGTARMLVQLWGDIRADKLAKAAEHDPSKRA